VLQRGQLRWTRLENLLRESAKSRGLQSDASPWLLAEWVLSDAGAAVRGPLVSEAVRMIDATMAGVASCHPDSCRVFNSLARVHGFAICQLTCARRLCWLQHSSLDLHSHPGMSSLLRNNVSSCSPSILVAHNMILTADPDLLLRRASPGAYLATDRRQCTGGAPGASGSARGAARVEGRAAPRSARAAA